MALDVEDVIAGLDPERRRRIEDRAAELIAEEMTLRSPPVTGSPRGPERSGDPGSKAGGTSLPGRLDPGSSPPGQARGRLG